MAETISAEEARPLVASRELFPVDIRPRDELLDNPERVPGSLHIPADEIESRLDELPEDRRLLIVSVDESESAEVAESLEQKGRETVTLEGGASNWSGGERLTQPSPDAALPDPEEQPHETAEEQRQETAEDDASGEAEGEDVSDVDPRAEAEEGTDETDPGGADDRARSS